MAKSRICSVDSCDNPARGRGWCAMHYARWLRHGDPNWQPLRAKCSVELCGNDVKGHGLCNRHYKRWRKFGDTSVTLQSERGAGYKWLMDHVPFDGEHCLIWPFGRTSAGYGLTTNNDGQKVYAHRQMCHLAYGPPPSELHEAAHRCGKGHEGCVNPQHLRWATPVENAADTVIHGTEVRGSNVPQSKLVDNQVREIRSLKGLMSQSAIGAKFGVSQTLVCRIMRREVWAWLD